MKVIFHREPFLTAASLAALAVPSKDIKPALKNLKLFASGDGSVTASATDLEIGVRVPVAGAEVIEPGCCLLPAAKLLAIFKEARDTKLEVEANDAGDPPAHVRGLDSSLDYEVPGAPASEFPDYPVFDAESYHEVGAEALRDLIKRTAFAVASEAQRYSMTGVMWELVGDCCRLVATDGRRLAVAETLAACVGGHATNDKASPPVVPEKAMTLLERLLADAGEADAAAACIRPNDAVFRVGGASLYTRLVEGRFPDWRAVMPADSRLKSTLTVPAATLTQAVRQAAIMTDAEAPRLACKFAPGRLTLDANGTEAGKSHVEVVVDYGGAEVLIAFNPQYLTDFTKVLPNGADVWLGLIDGGSPAVFRSGVSRYLVMPLQ